MSAENRTLLLIAIILCLFAWLFVRHQDQQDRVNAIDKAIYCHARYGANYQPGNIYTTDICVAQDGSYKIVQGAGR